MITEEPSQQVTPLSDEQAGFPQQAVRDDLQPPAPALQAWWVPWIDVLKAIGIWTLSFALLLVVPIILAIPYLIYSAVRYGPPRAETLATDKTLILLSIAGTILAHIFTLAALWFIVTGTGKRPFFSTLGLKWPEKTSPVLTTLVCFLTAAVLLVIGWAVTTAWGGGKTQLDLIVESSMAARFVTALAATATAPLIEELIYRGVLYSPLERAAGTGVAVAIVTLLFAGVHVVQYMNNLGVIIVITILSLTLTLVRAISGSVLPPFLIHLVFNGIQSLILVAAPFLDKSILEKGDQVTPTTAGFEIVFQLVEKMSVYLCRMT